MPRTGGVALLQSMSVGFKVVAGVKATCNYPSNTETYTSEAQQYVVSGGLSISPVYFSLLPVPPPQDTYLTYSVRLRYSQGSI